MNSNSHTLEVDSVLKYFEHKLILSDIYIKIHTNEIIGLLGRNGSGKSTLLKIIFGILDCDNKFIRIDNSKITNKNKIFENISYLPQENFVPNNFSVKKAIKLFIENNETGNFYDDEMISSIKNKKVSQLSGGELRYLEIKLILFKKSKFALLDEPYNGLSPIMIEKINDLILKNKIRKGIIITDHNYENVINLSNRLILMYDGKSKYITDESQLVEFGYLTKNKI
jgi:ABC-type lipopolysaccharide export system ATPase subunit